MAEPTGKPQGTKAGGKEGEEDLSMEEILQSIRRIIAEEGDEVKDAPTAPPPGDVPGSDVLELSDTAPAEDVLELSGEIADVTAEPPPVAEPTPAPVVDVLSRIDDALSDPAPTPPPAPVAAPVVAAPAPTPTPAPVAPDNKLSALTEDALISENTESAVAASLNKLKSIEEKEIPMSTTPSPAFRSGNTVEDMVVEFLRPMMKEWLDQNLPNIVERVVEHEVKRLTRN
ncbi:MAG: DUF2497 domain-containing protein [Rickettsiales bacterium]|nr:DUF2497 domain-containing protein [Rickettsiales bacterium]